MKFLITGMNGTVAPALARALKEEGHEIIAWDRSAVPTDNEQAATAFIRETAPDWFCQVATGSPDWIELTARVCKEDGVNFLFTGSVSVFDGGKSGPFPKDHDMNAGDDYGRYKADCERRIGRVNPDAIIASLGWQIGDAPGSNNMIDFLTNEQREHGQVVASTGWIPSTAFLVDTVDGLCRLVRENNSGLYQLEGNPNGVTFAQLAATLNKKHGGEWKIVEKDEPERDNRMIDDQFSIRAVDDRLGMSS